jgi:hypothetical protein
LEGTFSEEKKNDKYRKSITRAVLLEERKRLQCQYEQ